jgi:hypothetical protein
MHTKAPQRENSNSCQRLQVQGCLPSSGFGSSGLPLPEACPLPRVQLVLLVLGVAETSLLAACWAVLVAAMAPTEV